MSGRSRQAGVSAVEGLLMLIIIAILGFTGWYVWHSNQQTNKIQAETTQSIVTPKLSTGAACTDTANTYKGNVYTETYAAYSFCIPDGWKLYWDGDKTDSSLLGSAADLTYKAGTKPFVGKAGGKEGPFPFSIFYNAKVDSSAEARDSSWMNGGTIKTQGISGILYTRTETADETNGLGGVPKGTLQYDFAFQKGASSLVLEYNIFPGDKNQTALIKNVVSTLNFQ
jgi:hypothetical protein